MRHMERLTNAVIRLPHILQIMDNSSTGAGRILLVDDDPGMLRSLKAVLAQSGFEVTALPTVPEALEVISRQRFDILLSDMNIGEPGDGFTLVSAMRRVQPQATTFILTGYPDIESAIKAIRSQVDDYFAKPLNVEELLAAIRAARNGPSYRARPLGTQKISILLRKFTPAICDRWYEEIMHDQELAALPVSRMDRIDHVPGLLEELSQMLERDSDRISLPAAEAARSHGKVRQQQGYTVPQIVFETRILQKVICQIIQENLLAIELSTLVHDILEIGHDLQAELEIAIRSYQAQVPASLQTSFSMLYKSPYLGVVIADESRVIDANDAFLRMIGYTRGQLRRGEIDWKELTPEKYRPLDAAAVEQIREFGACAPIEKEFVLKDGRSLPFLIGATRLTIDPLQWSAYIVNLTKQRDLQAAQQKLTEWEAKNAVINRLAHEVNNPLAALVFTIHLLSTHPDLSEDMAKLLTDATEMLDRVSATVRRVLVESQR